MKASEPGDHQRCLDCDKAVDHYAAKDEALKLGLVERAAAHDAIAAVHEDKAVAKHLPWEPQEPQFGNDQ